MSFLAFDWIEFMVYCKSKHQKRKSSYSIQSDGVQNENKNITSDNQIKTTSVKEFCECVNVNSIAILSHWIRILNLNWENNIYFSDVPLHRRHQLVYSIKKLYVKERELFIYCDYYFLAVLPSDSQDVFYFYWMLTEWL